MYKTLVGTLAAISLLAACSSEPTVQTGADAEVIGGNLHRIDHSKVKMAYIDPQADFSKYTRVLLRPLGVDNVEIIQPQSSGSVVSGSRDWVLTDEDKDMLRQVFLDAMTRQLEEKGHFPIVTEADDDVLEIAAMITAIAPSGPKDDLRSRGAGRNYVITEGAGSIAVAFAFGDSQTGEVLALAKDSRSSNSFWGSNNSVSNMADVRHMFNSWALQIRSGLEHVTGKE